MNEIQRLQLDILIRLDGVCKKYGLRYYLAYGTCLGALRHQGFIPWDHDIDVLMPIGDARKLEEYQKEFAPLYFVTSYRTDSKFRSISMRIIDTEHKCKFIKEGREIEKTNIAIDVYPFYNCPEKKFIRLLNVWRSHIYKILVDGPPKNHGRTAIIVSKIILLFFSENERRKAIQKMESWLNYKGTSSEIADYFGLDISLCSVISYKKEWFSEPSPMLFEGHIFNGPTNADKYLRKRYGDYMTPPSASELRKETKCVLVNNIKEN